MSTIITPSEDQINIVITDDAVNVNITSEPVVVNVTDEIIQVSTASGAYPLPTTVYSVFGRTGAIIAQDGDYDLGELGDVTLVSKVNGDVLTYDGTKWINKAVSGTGTVTSVDMSVPTGLQVSGNPIIAAGTLAVNFADGYSIPTNAKQNNWDAAYNDKINSADVSGTTTKTLTLTQQDGGTITASWTDINTNIVTSVNTYIGDVVLTTTDIAEGLKLYYTEERVNANTNVAANTAARHAAVTIGTANGLSLSSQALSLALASASATGALSSTDWSTFNNKQNQLNGTGFVKASGTSISYDNSTYLTSADVSGYVPYSGATGDVNLGSNDITASAIIKAGGIDTQFLKADGSVDNNNYLTADDLPSTLSLYATTTPSAVSGYTKLVTTIEDPDYNTTAVDVSTGEITIVDQFIAALVSPANLINGNPGIFNVSTYGNIKKVSGSGQAEFYFKIYKRTSAGVETLVGTSSNTLPVVNSGYSEFFATAIWNDGVFDVTDTIVLKYYGSRIAGGSNPTYNFQFGGVAPVRTIVPIPTAVIPNIYLGELADVEDGTASNNDGIYYDSTASLWKYKSIAEVLGYTPLSLTSLSATAPLAYNNTTGGFSISQAGVSGNGYLSSTDWNTFNNKQAAGDYITALTGEATASGPGSSSVTLSTSAVTGKILTGINITGGSISATDSILVALGKAQNQINGLLGGAIYQSTWNASTNSPTLASGTGTKGYYYIVSVAGSTNLDGITDWKVGDWAIFNGTTWDKVDNTDAVSSVNGFTGAVSLTTANISEVTNLYYTEARVSANTNVAANTAARHAAVTLGTANGLSLSTQQLSLALASTTATGALSSTDWNTFNAKQAALSGTGFVKISGSTISYDNSTYYLASNPNGYTTNVGTVTSIATTGPITGGTITGSGTIGITQATTSASGYLSSTDWNTFNGKQNALTNPVTGTGTTNYLPKFTGASAIGNSSVQDDGSIVSVGSTLKLSGNSNSFQVASIFRNANRLFFGGDTGGYYFQNSANTATTLFIADNGNIGLNTTTDAGYKLDVNGTGRFSGALLGTSATFSSSVTADLLIISASDARIRNSDASGRLVIGNSTTSTYGIFYGASHATTPNTINFVANSISSLTLASTGAATFSSSVTATTMTLNSVGGDAVALLLSGDGSGNSAIKGGGGNLDLWSPGGDVTLRYNNSGGTKTIGLVVKNSSGNVQITSGTIQFASGPTFKVTNTYAGSVFLAGGYTILEVQINGTTKYIQLYNGLN